MSDRLEKKALKVVSAGYFRDFRKFSLELRRVPVPGLRSLVSDLVTLAKYERQAGMRWRDNHLSRLRTLLAVGRLAEQGRAIAHAVDGNRAKEQLSAALEDARLADLLLKAWLSEPDTEVEKIDALRMRLAAIAGDPSRPVGRERTARVRALARVTRRERNRFKGSGP